MRLRRIGARCAGIGGALRHRRAYARSLVLLHYAERSDAPMTASAVTYGAKRHLCAEGAPEESLVRNIHRLKPHHSVFAGIVQYRGGVIAVRNDDGVGEIPLGHREHVPQDHLSVFI